MAMSKELREYINNKYSQKINNLKKEKQLIVERYKKDIRQTDLILIDKLKNKIINFLTAVEEDFKGLHIHSNNSFINLKRGDFYYQVDFEIENEQVKFNILEIDNEINSLVAEQERLILILSLEKDFDVINKILDEYGLKVK